jgi:hypothetical protein
MQRIGPGQLVSALLRSYHQIRLRRLVRLAVATLTQRTQSAGCRMPSTPTIFSAGRADIDLQSPKPEQYSVSAR